MVVDLWFPYVHAVSYRVIHINWPCIRKSGSISLIRKLMICRSLQSTPTQEADTEDGPVSPEKKNQEAGVCRADKVADDKAASEQYWKDVS
jgi:hypothetical protein